MGFAADEMTRHDTLRGFIKMPIAINWHNGSHERCDVAQGPCACGAWHTLEDWPAEIQELIQRNLKDEANKQDTPFPKITE